MVNLEPAALAIFCRQGVLAFFVFWKRRGTVMKKQALLCAILLTFLASTVSVFGQNQATAPTYYEGERWEYDLKVDFRGQGYSSEWSNPLRPFIEA